MRRDSVVTGRDRGYIGGHFENVVVQMKLDFRICGKIGRSSFRLIARTTVHVQTSDSLKLPWGLAFV